MTETESQWNKKEASRYPTSKARGNVEISDEQSERKYSEILYVYCPRGQHQDGRQNSIGGSTENNRRNTDNQGGNRDVDGGVCRVGTINVSQHTERDRDGLRRQ